MDLGKEPPGTLTYPKRALATLLVAAVPGSLLGGLWMTLANAALSLQELDFPIAMKMARDTFFGEFLASSFMALPFALVVGLIVASIVWKSGGISLRKTTAIAVFFPTAAMCVIFGGFGFIFGLLYAVPALLTVVILRSAGIWVARRYFGVAA